MLDTEGLGGEGVRQTILRPCPLQFATVSGKAAVFLKLLVLLVPREMKVEHAGGVKGMTDEQLEAGIEAIQRMLEARAASEVAKVIDAVPEPLALPAPSLKPRRKHGVQAKPAPSP